MGRGSIRVAAAVLIVATVPGCAMLRLPFAHHRVAGKPGAEQAAAAQNALKKRNWSRAVTLAERAVTLDGTNGEWRGLLGTAYLRAGRFQSAAQSFDDALALRQADGTTALHLVLALIASGQHDAAQAALVRYAALIPAADRGLAMALAGEPGQGVEVLMAAMRVPGADARTRQNLALTLALAGEWSDAFFLVGLDLPPAQAKQRILEWMHFARPTGAADQVAALLKVTPVADPGQPEALALKRAATPAVAVQDVDRYMPGPADEAVETAAVAGLGVPRR